MEKTKQWVTKGGIGKRGNRTSYDNNDSNNANERKKNANTILDYIEVY